MVLDSGMDSCVDSWASFRGFNSPGPGIGVLVKRGFSRLCGNQLQCSGCEKIVDAETIVSCPSDQKYHLSLCPFALPSEEEFGAVENATVQPDAKEPEKVGGASGMDDTEESGWILVEDGSDFAYPGSRHLQSCHGIMNAVSPPKLPSIAASSFLNFFPIHF